MRNIAMKSKDIEEIFEKKKQEKDNNRITKSANFDIFTSSIFFPTQIKIKLLSKVADAYTEPN